MMYYGICKSKEYKESMLLGNMSYQLKLLGREAMQCITLRNESNKLLFQDFSNLKVFKMGKVSSQTCLTKFNESKTAALVINVENASAHQVSSGLFLYFFSSNFRLEYK